MFFVYRSTKDDNVDLLRECMSMYSLKVNYMFPVDIGVSGLVGRHVMTGREVQFPRQLRDRVKEEIFSLTTNH